MNEKVNNFSLAGDKFMPEMCLIHPGITYSACVLFTKNKERVQKSTEIRVSRYIYHNELDEACFHHNMAYGNLKDLTRRTASDKVFII